MKASFYLATAALVTSLTSARADCLDDVANFADKICGQIRTVGKAGLLTGNGDLNATAKELIAKSLGQLSGHGSTATKTYEDILQEQLGAERVSLRKCGIALAKAAIDQTCFKEN
jgi:hypothetical protein